VTEAIVVVAGAEAVITGEGDVVTEILTVAMEEALTAGARDTPGHHEDAILEIEAHLETPQGNQTLMYPEAEVDRSTTTVPELLPPNLDRHLLHDQNLVPRLVGVRVLRRDHALLPLAVDLERPTDEGIPIEGVEDGEEEGAQIVHHVEDHPLHPEVPARAPLGHPSDEQPRILSAHLRHPGLDALAAIRVPCLGLPLDRLAGHLAEECPAAEKGLARPLPRMLRKMPRICEPEVVNVG